MDTSFVYRDRRRSWPRRLRVIGIVAALVAVPAAAGAEPAAASRKPSGPAGEGTRETPFGRSLRVESTELDSRLEGRIHSVIDHPFSRAQALADPAHWCELLPLLPNIRLSFANTSSDSPGSIREPRAQGVSQVEAGRSAFRLTVRGFGGFTIDERAGRLLRTGDECAQWSRGR